ncbi:WXG100 family type VII secretion target [Flexivirga caeni]|uniref:WXG100 family type VII secretion target n=1 Tax=Flexivirga caeni TaxID=2294115 RepID=A0A3M9M9U6_9MICO|nr:hypothetical protein [Flexivirga caeni]RNI22276.1 hypothetical protein EFY87_09910 [Flexivirga caeni]
MAFKGMDVDILTGVHTQLTSLQGQLDTLIQQLTTQVNTAHEHWDGSDSTQFESEWASSHKVALTNASHAITSFASKLNSNIQAQEQTSSTY